MKFKPGTLIEFDNPQWNKLLLVVERNCKACGATNGRHSYIDCQHAADFEPPGTWTPVYDFDLKKFTCYQTKFLQEASNDQV